MTPYQKVEIIRGKHGGRFTKLMLEAKKLPLLPRNIDHRANRLYEIIDEISTMVEPTATCKRGCSHCCYQSVIITSWEAAKIAKFTRRKFAMPNLDSAEKKDELIERYAGKPCPFLSNNECTIYDVRPSMCRTHFSLADDNSACDIISRPGDRVPYFDLESLKTITGFLFASADCKFGDIREFFGE